MILSLTRKINRLSQDDRILLFFVILLLTSGLDVYFGGARYLKYTIGIFTIVVLILKRGRLTKELAPVHWAFLGLCTWGGISLFWGNSINGLKDIVFIATYTLPFFVLRPSSDLIDLSLTLTIGFFLLTLPAQEIGQFSLQNSQGLFEGGASFVFGLYAVHYLSRRKYLVFLICLVLVAITLKRIALLGATAAIFIYLLPIKIQKIATRPYFILALNGCVVLGIFLLTTGWLDNQVENLTGMNATWLTLGRTHHYLGVVSDVIQNPINIIFGNGIGSAYQKATIAYEGDFLTPNLHSDTLKILYEYGFIFFVAFFICLGQGKNIGAQMITIYTSIVFATDNTLIYSNVMFVYMMCFTFLNNKSKLQHSKDGSSENRHKFSLSSLQHRSKPTN